MTPEQAEHVLIWEFQVREEAVADFEATYGPRGAWAKLFARSEGYLGTELLRDTKAPRRYLTIDRWVDAGAFAQFRAAHGAEYSRLDALSEPWSEKEAQLGAWTAVRP